MQFSTTSLSLKKTGHTITQANELIGQLLGMGEAPQFRVLELFDPKELVVHSRQDFPADAKEAVVVDTETTGKDAETAGLIELGMVKFCYHPKTMEVYGITGVFSELEDPGMEISAEASMVNGLTNEMVKGKAIKDEDVTDFLAGTVLAIAHNAGYDRPVCERRFPIFKDIAWACSYKEVNWLATWGPGAGLESICAKQGFFYVAHRAVTDCFALLRALCEAPPATSEMPSALVQLFDSARKPSYRIWATNAQFEKSSLMKERGYRWNPGTTPGTMKAWCTSVTRQELDSEMYWLGETIYDYRSVMLPVEQLTAKVRYSSRYVQPVYQTWKPTAE